MSLNLELKLAEEKLALTKGPKKVTTVRSPLYHCLSVRNFVGQR